MLTKNINFTNFKFKPKNKNLKKYLKIILNENNQVIRSLKKNYKNKFTNKTLNIFNNKFDFRVIGMGGSILGTHAIYDFLNERIKKKFYFIDNLNAKIDKKFKNYYNNLVVSKSGNTIETILNSNIYIKKKR